MIDRSTAQRYQIICIIIYFLFSIDPGESEGEREREIPSPSTMAEAEPLRLAPIWRSPAAASGGGGGFKGGTEGTYRVLQRIVTPHPTLASAAAGGAGGVPSPLPGGEITTTVEEYYPPAPGYGPPVGEGGPSPRSVAGGADGAGSREEEAPPPPPPPPPPPSSLPPPLLLHGVGDRKPLFRRVAVRWGAAAAPGEGGGRPVATCELPCLALTTLRRRPGAEAGPDGLGDGLLSDPMVCWAPFGTRGRMHLCVLAGPSLLRIFDVFPPAAGGGDDEDGGGGGGGEGHSVTLPFECRGIHPIPSGGSGAGGLLLQRAPTVEESYAASSGPDRPGRGRNLLRRQPSSQEDSSQEEGSVELIRPPSGVRRVEGSHEVILGDVRVVLKGLSDGAGAGGAFAGGGAGTSMDLDSDGPPGVGTGLGGDIPSLFSLSHPLDEVRPVALLPPAADAAAPLGAAVSDPGEELVYVGRPRAGLGPGGRRADRASAPGAVAVTYHSRLRRRAVWAVGAAPPLPETLPLWRRTAASRRRREMAAGGGSGAAGPSDVSATAAVDHGWVMLGEEGREEEDMEQDGDAVLAAPVTAATPRLPPAFGELHPTVTISLLYEEPREPPPAIDQRLQSASSLIAAPPARERIFLSTNSAGSADSVLCWLFPRPDGIDGHGNGRLLRRLNLIGGGAAGGDRKPGLLLDLACIDAVPIMSTPVPDAAYHPDSKGRHGFGPCPPPRSIDVLVHQAEATLSLHRGAIKISDCSLSDLGVASGMEENILPLRLADPVSDRITLRLQSLTIRAALGLVLKSPVAESALGAVEASLALSSKSGIGVDTMAGLALAIRADCLSRSRSGLIRASEAVTDIEWLAFSQVITSFFDELLAKSERNKVTKNVAAEHVATEPCISDWDTLLSSGFHADYSRNFGHLFQVDQTESGRGTQVPCSEGWLCRTKTNMEASVSLATARAVFDILHLFYEDCKLCRNSRGRSWASQVGQLLLSICHKSFSDESMIDFVDHYHRDGLVDLGFSHASASAPNDTTTNISVRLSSHASPPCLFAWVDSILRRETDHGESFAIFDGSLCPPATRNVRRLLVTLYESSFKGTFQTEEDATRSLQRQRYMDRNLVVAMVFEGLTDPQLLTNELPPGIALPFMEALHRCRSDPPTPSDPSETNSNHFSVEGYRLIGRTDLAQMQAQRNMESKLAAERPKGKMGDLRKRPSSARVSQSGKKASDVPDLDQDGLAPLAASTRMLYPHDTRIDEVIRLLRSSRPVFLRVPRAVEVTDHEFERIKQDKLGLLCTRVVALPLGRGMATICSLDTVGHAGSISAIPAEPLKMPQISLAGRVPPTNATLSLDASSMPPDMMVWPEFHNGVAAGLRLPKAGDAGASQITRTWIIYNRPIRDSNETSGSGIGQQLQAKKEDDHAGLLFALGIQGHLSSLSMTDVYDYLTQGTVTTTAGILLGMAACKRGTCDPSVSKMLCLHIPSLLPPSFATMEVAPPARTAAVSGVGLLYMGSGHRLMTEFLIGEIGRRPSSDGAAVGREAYALSCGIALGMVNLSKGIDVEESENYGGSAGLSDLRIEERLQRYVVGGLEDPETKSKREASDRAAAGMGGGGGNGGGSDHEKCSCLYEGENINTNVTAPGATLALGLMYLQTGNKSVASRLSLPDTHFLLDYVRPDLLLLRVVARSMILWSDVEASSAWIDAQIPDIISSSFDAMAIKAERTAGFAGLASFAAMHMNSSPENSQPVLPGSAGGGRAGDRRTFQTKKLPEGNVEDPDLDRQAIRQAHVHVVAGACLGMGLRFAGSGNEAAAAAIMERVEHFIRLRDESDPVSVALRPERSILEMCLSCATVSLAMVMAGTGDVEVLKLLRALRWRCDEDVRYGTHMAIGSAIGLLFLGGGKCTLGTEPKDIASLVMAFFPRFPASTSDNQYHLQALRHCYALAVKRRLLQAVDIDTKENVFVPVEVILKGNCAEPLQLTTPRLLLNKGDISRLRVVSERYYPASLDLNLSSASDSHLTLFVKKKSGHLSYQQDPHAQRSLLVQTGGSGGGSALQLIEAFTEDTKLLAYAKYLCNNGRGLRNGGRPKSLVLGKETGLGNSVEEFCTDVLHECLTKGKTEAIGLYLALRHAAISAVNNSWNIETVWDLRLVRSYYEGWGERDESPPPHLSPDFVWAMSVNLDRHFYEKGFTRSVLLNYLESGGRWEEMADNDEGTMLGCFLAWNDVPFPLLSSTSQHLKNELIGMYKNN